jgi:acetyl-CoA C-acetyltransferase
MELKEVFILSAVRTPIGSYGGVFSNVSAVQLGAEAVKCGVERAGVAFDAIEEVVMGNVLSANLGQAPARQAAIHAGLPEDVCATTVNKVCSSGMKAVSMIYKDIRMNDIELGVAGGMESMSQTPFYLPNARFGLGYGNKEIVDGLAKDGLTDVYNECSMGVCGDKTAERYHISREEQDDYAEKSYRRSAYSWENGDFRNEVVEVKVSLKKGMEVGVSEDEEFKRVNFEKMRTLRPAFSSEGTVTAASSSPMSDGASALVLAGGEFVHVNGLLPLARIIAYGEAEQDPMFFTTSPVLATQKVLEKAGLTIKDIDFFEVNEAFSVVPLAYMKILGISDEKINVFGGAISLGHPIGSSGARILTTLVNILNLKDGHFGLAAICNGGGGASAMIIERIR